MSVSEPHIILSRVLPHAYMALGYYLWISDFKHALNASVLTEKFAVDLLVKVEIDYLEFSVAEGSLVALRKFDDFFCARGAKFTARNSDDIFVTDFIASFPVGRFLTDEERLKINKTVAHLTSYKSPYQSLSLNILNITSRFMDKFCLFCDYIEDEKSESIPDSVIQVAQGFRAQLDLYKSTLSPE